MKTTNLFKFQILKELENITIEAARFFQVEPSNCQVRLEYSRDEKFGHYSSPVALENKTLFQKPPMEIANWLAERFHLDLVKEVTVTAPGFLNFKLSEEGMISFSTFMSEGDLFAKVDKSNRINLEFVSANPTGPLNIVSARSAAYGDTLVRLLKTLGHEVDSEFYVNDYGNQVYLLGVAVLLRIRELQGNKIVFQEEEDGTSIEDLVFQHCLPKESYRGEYLIPVAKQILGEAIPSQELEEVFQSQNRKKLVLLINKAANHTIKVNLESQIQDLQNFGVKYNTFFRESSLHEKDKVLSIIHELKVEDKIKEDGKVLFLSTKYGDDKDRVILRGDGRPTYLLADIAYHKDKFERGYDLLIDIWGPDHYGYIARLRGALQSLGFAKERFSVLIAQQVNLLEEGKKVKMSKRLGIFQTMPELLGYLGKNGVDVARYFFLMRSSDAPLDFDLDLAKDESDKNPVFYLQYAHARICSIYRELGEDPKKRRDLSLDSLRQEEDRIRLLYWIGRFPEEVFDSSRSLEPHRLTNYLQSLAKNFTKFYGNKENRIKEKHDTERDSLLELARLTGICLKEGLSLLGISAPEFMHKEKG